MSLGRLASAEERLGRLLGANEEGARYKLAQEWKKQGKKILGLVCPYVPEELIFAANILPWRITGSWRASTPLATVYRPVNTCYYCTHVLELVLNGELDFLDGIVFSDWDDDTRRLYDVCAHLGKPKFVRLIHVPHQDSELAYQHFTGTLTELSRKIELLGGLKLHEDRVRQAVEVYNKTRTLLAKVYELRRRKVPPLSGTETLKLVTASFVMPKDEYNRELESLMGYLENRETSLKRVQPRLLVASDRLDNPAYLELIEDEGALIAMDDMDTGSRYIYGLVDTGLNIMYALAKRYISHPPCPRMAFWERQVEQVVEWVRQYQINGVVHFPQMYSFHRLNAAPYFAHRLEEAGIPVTTVLRKYHLANSGQLRTRVRAFLEVLG